MECAGLGAELMNEAQQLLGQKISFGMDQEAINNCNIKFKKV
jgi:hypothetical protein